MVGSAANNGANEQYRATALRHAQGIQDRMETQNRIADMIVEAYDLPSSPDAVSAAPLPSDVYVFKSGLKLFQPSDFDDLVFERNVDGRCGYALCPRPKSHVAGGGEKVWNGRGGKSFQLLDRSELEKWCSKECEERAIFAKAQLPKVPAWLRDSVVENITLLHEVGISDQTQTPSFNKSDIVGQFRKLALEQSSDEVAREEAAERMKSLSLERDSAGIGQVSSSVSIVERLCTEEMPDAPSIQSILDEIEGHQPKR